MYLGPIRDAQRGEGEVVGGRILWTPSAHMFLQLLIQSTFIFGIHDYEYGDNNYGCDINRLCTALLVTDLLYANSTFFSSKHHFLPTNIFTYIYGSS